MLKDIKQLGRESLLYGLSTVLGRFLNILLLPLHTYFLSPAELGVVATLFSYLAFLNILYGYGIDFAFMRHDPGSRGRSDSPARTCFSTAFWSLAATSLAFSGLIHAAAGPLSALAGVPASLSDAVRYSAWILAFDALALIPFAQLRLNHRAGLYAGVKIFNIAMNVALSYVFLARWRMGASGVFLANMISSCATLAALSPVLAAELEGLFDWPVYKSLLRFALPLVPAGLASMVVQVIDRPILKFLTDDATVGLYQANYRLGILMMMGINMFDMAWRPFFLQRGDAPDSKRLFARILTYFVLAGSAVLLFIHLFIASLVAIPILAGRPLIHPNYWIGLPIVPVVTASYLFNGIYVNMLAPVSLAKRTELVAYATAAGALVNVPANLLLIPAHGMMGAAWATLLAYATMALALFLMGRKVYPIDYEYGRLAHIALCLGAAGAGAYFLGLGVGSDRLGVRALLLLAFPAALVLTGFLEPEEQAALRKRILKL
ncbi:MAG: oligosaccharide flippase family protein [Elusimicrobia bacterium]|nr:oligosaccharide flippase family protein [Elusimicrobiota bacterium]